RVERRTGKCCKPRRYERILSLQGIDRAGGGIERSAEHRMDVTNDLSSFESAALPHFAEIYRTARRVRGNPRDAGDRVQEAYLHAWKSFHRFEPGTNCRAWIYKILFHRIHHHRRRWFTSRVVQETEDGLSETLAYQPPVPETIRDEDILAALDRLPAEY